MVKCQICLRDMKQITNSHVMKSHGISLTDYREKYPNAEIVSAEIKNKIKTANTGKVRTEEHKRNLRKSIQEGFKYGRIVHNKGIVGVVKDSPETKERKSKARLGKKHSEETKAKIGSKHKGKTRTPEEIEKWRVSFKAAIEENGGGFNKGHKHTEEFKRKLSEIAKNRPRETQLANIKLMIEARKNWVPSDDQRLTYRNARLKYMAENPQKLVDTAGEIQVRTWLDENGINYIQQYAIYPYGHPYDFYLPAYNTLIEFDGTHHWDRIWFNVSDKTEEEKRVLLEKQMEKDAIENYEAGRRGFKIVRLRGWTIVGDAPGCPSLEEQLSIQGFKK